MNANWVTALTDTELRERHEHVEDTLDAIEREVFFPSEEVWEEILEDGKALFDEMTRRGLVN